MPRSAPTSSDAYGSIAGGSWNCAATAPDSRVNSASPVTAFQGGSGVPALSATSRERLLAWVRSRRVGIPYSASSASATSTRSAFPARSPIPLIVPCTQVAPAWTAAIAAAVPSPKSSWPCQCTGTSRRSSARETRNAAASGVAIPSVSTTTDLGGAGLDRGLVARSKNSRSAREESTPKNATRIPCSVANATALRIRSSIVSRETPRASSLPSEIGLSITEARHAELDEHVDVGLHGAREAPDLGLEPRRRDRLDGLEVVGRDAREAGLDPVDPRRVERLRDLELLVRCQHDADRLLAVTQRRVVEPDGRARLRVERLLVDRPRPDLRSVERHACTTPSGNGESFSAPSAVMRKLSSTRRPPPPSQ